MSGVIAEDIRSLADGFRVTAALIRVQHDGCCGDCEVWSQVAQMLEEVAAVFPSGCVRRQRRAFAVMWAYLSAGQPVEVPA